MPKKRAFILSFNAPNAAHVRTSRWTLKGQSRHTGAMSHDAPSEASELRRTRASPRAGTPLQFSLSTLMLVLTVVGLGCAAIRWLGSIWFVPAALAAFSGACLILAVRQASNWRMLKLGYWHCVIWFGLATAASGLTVRGCLNYNTVAGTDKTDGHILQISAATLAGPMTGPVANSGAGEAPMARRWTAILLTVQFMTVCPFLFVRRPVPLVFALTCWIAFVSATILWFFGAMISLGVFLS